jgi:3-oxoacyl-[acyl-carrier-protein] synthase I
MSDVVIVGTGLMCSVGLTSREVAIAARARTMRFEESPVFDHRFAPVAAGLVPDEALPPLRKHVAADMTLPARVLRMLRLATVPLQESASALPAARTALFLALPETTTTLPLDPSAFLQALAHQVPGVFDPTTSQANCLGRAGGLFAVGDAVAAVISGRAEVAIAGGVDTYFDLFVLGMLNSERRIKSPSTLDGFIPGEGAAFLLLASPRVAAARGLRAFARVGPVARGAEPGHLYSEQPYRGDGLADTIRSAVSDAAASLPVSHVYSSMNGESHWAKEWGVAFLRSRKAFDEQHSMAHPADCYGEIGAASGPMMVALSALGIDGGRLPGTTLVYASSDRGARAAVLLQPAS